MLNRTSKQTLPFDWLKIFSYQNSNLQRTSSSCFPRHLVSNFLVHSQPLSISSGIPQFILFFHLLSHVKASVVLGFQGFSSQMIEEISKLD